MFKTNLCNYYNYLGFLSGHEFDIYKAYIRELFLY